MDNREAITRAILDAYSELLYPGDECLFETNQEPCVRIFLRETEGRRSWRAVLQLLQSTDWATQRELVEAIAFMTWRAYYYYSPVLLIFSMDDAADLADMAALWGLTPLPQRVGDGSPNSYHNEAATLRTSLMSTEQKRAVALVAEYQCGRQDPEDESPQDDLCDHVLLYWRKWL